MLESTCILSQFCSDSVPSTKISWFEFSGKEFTAPNSSSLTIKQSTQIFLLLRVELISDQKALLTL